MKFVLPRVRSVILTLHRFKGAINITIRRPQSVRILVLDAVVCVCVCRKRKINSF